MGDTCVWVLGQCVDIDIPPLIFGAEFTTLQLAQFTAVFLLVISVGMFSSSESRLYMFLIMCGVVAGFSGVVMGLLCWCVASAFRMAKDILK